MYLYYVNNNTFYYLFYIVLCSYFEVINKKREYDFMSNITNNTLIM